MIVLSDPPGKSAPRILLNGVPTTVADASPMTTLLDWLRDHRALCGTKEGCAEGDCGACTVVLERSTADGTIQRNPVNACLTMMGQLDGAGIRTIEGLAAPGGALHPVQAAFASGGGTQCGFCTPGFVMSTYAFAQSGATDTVDVHDVIAGNLCRCTGYRPIVEAINSVTPLKDDPIAHEDTKLLAAFGTIARSADAAFTYEDREFYAPRSLATAAALRAQHPAALLLAGGTDLGLLVSRQRQKLTQIIHLGAVAELNVIEDRGSALALGAAVTYARAVPLLVEHYPGINSYLTRLGSRQIRSMGTIGGNLGTASPIGDFLPILLALDATIVLYSARAGRRSVPAADFFIGYRKTALAADELIETILLPKLVAGSQLFVDKISKRRDQDISAVCAAFCVASRGDTVVNIKLAYGGVAATPKRALATEAVLRGHRLTANTIADAEAALRKDFAPLSDWRGSADYRTTVAANLLRRLQLRLAPSDVPLELDTLCL
jgi:xanthine dehydrogenase small subunit